MRTLLITFLLFCSYSSYSVSQQKCGGDTAKAKLKQTERAKKPKKTTEEPDVRIQPNFMTLIYN